MLPIAWAHRNINGWEIAIGQPTKVGCEVGMAALIPGQVADLVNTQKARATLLTPKTERHKFSLYMSDFEIIEPNLTRASWAILPKIWRSSPRCCDQIQFSVKNCQLVFEWCPNLQRVEHGLRGRVFICSVLFAVSLQSACTTERQQTSADETPAPTSTAAVEECEECEEIIPHSPHGTASMRAYRDPKTGEWVSPPTGVSSAEASASADALSTSHTGLEVTPSPTPGEGIMVDLQGRFQSPVTATQDAEVKRSNQPSPQRPNAGEE